MKKFSSPEAHLSSLESHSRPPEGFHIGVTSLGILSGGTERIRTGENEYDRSPFR